VRVKEDGQPPDVIGVGESLHRIARTAGGRVVPLPYAARGDDRREPQRTTSPEDDLAFQRRLTYDLIVHNNVFLLTPNRSSRPN